MRHYQRTKNNPHLLPHNVYMQCLYAVRDYDRMKKEMQDILFASPGASDGMPRGSTIGNPTSNKAIKRESLQQRCEAIEQALLMIPLEYRRGVMNNILYQCGYPADAGEATYQRWRQRFLHHVAENSNFI